MEQVCAPDSCMFVYELSALPREMTRCVHNKHSNILFKLGARTNTHTLRPRLKWIEITEMKYDQTDAIAAANMSLSVYVCSYARTHK